MFIVYDHRDFFVECKGFDPQNIWQEIQDTEKYEYNDHIVFPVYAYIHSGVALSLGNQAYPFNDRWDVSMKGFLLYKKGSIDMDMQRKSRPELKDKTDNEIIKHFAKGLIETWNEYLSGQVFGFQAEINGEKDSCWSYYGDPEKSGIIDEAKNFIDYLTRPWYIKLRDHFKLKFNTYKYKFKIWKNFKSETKQALSMKEQMKKWILHGMSLLPVQKNNI